MRTYTRTQRWVMMGLAVFCALLIVRLVFMAAGPVAGSHRVLLPARQPRTPTKQAAGTPIEYDPVVRLDLLRSLNGRAVPQTDRDPFAFGPSPEEIQARKLAAQPLPPPGPPPPPPIPFKAVGYQEDLQGRWQAYLTDGQETYIVHEGQEFARRFKVLRITPAWVEVEDEVYHETGQLPFPQ